jgi:F420-dependent oxidoreductase-like protein
MTAMRVGLQVTYFTWAGGNDAVGETFGDVAKRAEDAGFYSLWVMDHFFQLPGLGAAELDMLEGYTALGFAAGRTSRIKLGTLVTGNTYRNPGVLVKAVTTLDVLSGGRAYFGVGAGWFEREHIGFGVHFGTFTERFQKLEETLRITHQMWSEDNGPFEGKHYQMAETICTPQPVANPHPPIMIGGRGEKKTLRMVAQYADAWNMGGGIDDNGIADFERLSAILRGHCDRLGRPYDAIEKTVLGTLWLKPEPDGRWLGPEQAVDLFGRFRAAGVDQVIFNIPNVDKPETIALIADKVIPAVVGL